jgi:hypothetical protein
MILSLEANNTSTYSIFGLHLLVNQLIPGLKETNGKGDGEVQVWIGSIPPWLSELLEGPQQIRYASPYLDEKGEAVLRVWEFADRAYFRLSYSDGTEFLINRAGTQIWARWADGATWEDTLTYLLGPVIGLVLRLQGITCLHASAVAVDGHAIALVGPGGAGKSTTAAAFAKQGYPVLSDDIVTLREHANHFMVQPGYPYLCLWPDSVKNLYGIPDALPRLTPRDGINAWWDKRYLDLQKNGYTFQEKPLALKAIYILSGYSADRKTPFIEAVFSRDILMSLIANSYMTYLLDNDMHMEEFKSLAKVVNRIPLRKVTLPTDPTNLPKLCKVILDDFWELMPLT